MIVAYRVQNGWLVRRQKENTDVSGYVHVDRFAEFLVFTSLQAMCDHYRKQKSRGGALRSRTGHSRKSTQTRKKTKI